MCPHRADGARPQPLCWPGAQPAWEPPDQLGVGAAARPTARLTVALTLRRTRAPRRRQPSPHSQKPRAVSHTGPSTWGLCWRMTQTQETKLLPGTELPPPSTQNKKALPLLPQPFSQKETAQGMREEASQEPSRRYQVLLRALPEAQAVGPADTPSTGWTQRQRFTASLAQPHRPPPATETTWMGPAPRSSWQEVQGPTRHQQPWRGEPGHLILGWSC